MPPRLHRLILLVLALSFPLLGSSCSGTRNLVDPVVQIHTPGGNELGVTTDYGIVFLGRTASAGDIEITAWFGDGPSIEPSSVEPIGGGSTPPRRRSSCPRSRSCSTIPRQEIWWR